MSSDRATLNRYLVAVAEAATSGIEDVLIVEDGLRVRRERFEQMARNVSAIHAGAPIDDISLVLRDGESLKTAVAYGVEYWRRCEPASGEFVFDGSPGMRDEYRQRLWAMEIARDYDLIDPRFRSGNDG